MLSISTAWNYKKSVNVRRMLLGIKATGLNHIELGYQLTGKQLEEVEKILPEVGLKVLSVHNFCPLPDDEPSPRHPSNYYRLSALDVKERRKAVEWTKKAIDTAARVGAEVVVIHAGTVEIVSDPALRIFQLYKEGKRDTQEFQQLRDGLLTARAANQKKYIDALLESLADVMDYAQKKNVKIGLETRYYPTEIPNQQEVGFFLDRFHHQGMFYWHDVGHAEVNERLGITPHLDFLRPYADRIIGWHLHGLKILRDHHAPFDSDFDFAKVFPFIKKHHIKVIESHGLATSGQIKEAVKRLSVLKD